MGRLGCDSICFYDAHISHPFFSVYLFSERTIKNPAIYSIFKGLDGHFFGLGGLSPEVPGP